MENAQPTTQAGQSRRRKLVGVVSSAAGDKTIRVIMENLVKNPRYGKYLMRRTKLAAHDEKNAARKGDVVEIVACRRISKSKSFRLLRVIRRADQDIPAPADQQGAQQ